MPTYRLDPRVKPGDEGDLNYWCGVGGGNLDPSKFDFKAGGPNDIVMVRVYYKWAGLISGVMKNFGLDFSNEVDGSTLIVGTVVFRHEPYHLRGAV